MQARKEKKKSLTKYSWQQHKKCTHTCPHNRVGQQRAKSYPSATDT